MTGLTAILAAAMLLAALTPGGYGRALAVGGATPVGAALVAGGIAVPTFYAAAVGAAAGLAVRLLLRTRAERFPYDLDRESFASPRFPGAVPLLLFAAWSIIVTLIAPQIFAGTLVTVGDQQTVALRDGFPSTSNIAQMVYLLLSLAVVFYLAGSRSATVGLLGLLLGLTTLLSFWRLLGQLTPVPFPEGLFDGSPAFRFIDTAPDGTPRFRGIFSEPSGLAMSALATIAYSASRARRITGYRRIMIITVGIIAVVLAILSTSTTVIIAGIVLAALAAVAAVGGVFFRSRPITPLFVAGASAAAVAGVVALPIITNTVSAIIESKVASSSFAQRSGADARSYDVVLETYGFGVGVGSNRPSSFLAALLSTTGIIGTVLLIVAVIVIARRASRLEEYRPVIWTLVATLVTKLIASPDISDTSGVLWVSLGLLARAAVLKAREREWDADRAPSTAGVRSLTD